jgi:hypothetical protein
MKIKVEEPVVNTCKPSSYPWIGTYHDWVVMFTGPNTGVVLQSDMPNHKTGKLYDSQLEHLYKPFHGKITIEV